MIATPTLADILEELRNGETAASLACRLGEPPGYKCDHSPRRIVPILNRGRRDRILAREIRSSDVSPAVAHWRLA